MSQNYFIGVTLYMFLTVLPSIISSNTCLVAVCTVLNYWWWTERPSETCRIL